VAAAGNDRDALQGKWQRTSPQAAAVMPLAGPNGEDVTTYGLFIINVNVGDVEIKGDKLTCQPKPSLTPVELTVTLDPAKTPKTIDAANRRGATVFRGIYELNGDTLRLCVSVKDRPKEFRASRDTPLLEFKRK
jgi:uncharacterized protein (TIGR03067 family)